MLSPRELNEHQWLINASRGDVLDFGDEDEMPSKNVIALDVFPGEPSISPSLVMATRMASPHVGGNTHFAKKNATRMLLEKAAELYGIPLPNGSTTFRLRGQDAATVRRVEVKETMSIEEAFSVIANGIHGLSDLFKGFRRAYESCGPEESGRVFKEFRLESRRASFQSAKVAFDADLGHPWERALEAHGIRVVELEHATLHVKGSLPIFEA